MELQEQINKKKVETIPTNITVFCYAMPHTDVSEAVSGPIVMVERL